MLCDDSTRILKKKNQNNHYDFVIKKKSYVTFEKPGFAPKSRTESPSAIFMFVISLCLICLERYTVLSMNFILQA